VNPVEVCAWLWATGGDISHRGGKYDALRPCSEVALGNRSGLVYFSVIAAFMVAIEGMDIFPIFLTRNELFMMSFMELIM